MSTIHIFIAYARKDTPYLDKLRVYLRPIDRNSNVTIWYDGLIDPGAEWEESIKTQLYKAEIILLLMSAHSLNSDFFYEREMKKAMEQHGSGKSIVIPVILSHCLWDDPDLQLADLQALPKDGIPITKWEHESEAYDYIARGVRKSVQVVRNRRKIAKEKAERERLEVLRKEKEVKESLQQIVNRKEKERLEELRKEQAAAKRKQEETAANQLLELEDAEGGMNDTSSISIAPVSYMRSLKNNGWIKFFALIFISIFILFLTAVLEHINLLSDSLGFLMYAVFFILMYLFYRVFIQIDSDYD